MAPVNPDALIFTNVPIVPEGRPKELIVSAVARASPALILRIPSRVEGDAMSVRRQWQCCAENNSQR